MAAEPSSVSELELGHVLFMDIVGYSRLLVDEQSGLSQQLNLIVRNTEQVVSAERKGKLIRLPTGDGMALVFFTSPEAPMHCALEISRALKEKPAIKLRMGLHSGPVNTISDVNERENVAGVGINVAQRIMDCGDAGHILLSKRVAEDLSQYARWRPYLHDLGQIEVKHGVKIDVASFYNDDVGNAELPEKFKQARERTTRADRVAVTRRRKRVLLTAALLLAVASSLGLWTFFHRSSLRAFPISDKSIAVLPFENLSKDEENAFFAGGVQDEILTNLAKIADLKVISRTSVMKYKSGPERNLREIAKTLGVSHVVEGSVQRAGERIRVSAQLIDARNDTHLWAEHYDRDVADVFAIQSEIAQRIADQLQAKLSAAEKAAIVERPTTDLVAYAYYSKAKEIDIYGNWEGAENEKAANQKVELLEKATQRDPNFALAYCELAKAQLDLGNFELAKKAAETGLRLRPDLAEPHLAVARYCWLAPDSIIGYVGVDREAYYDRARDELAIVRHMSPNNVEALLIDATVGRHQNRWDASLANLQKASELDPRNSEVAFRLEQIYFEMRRYSELEQFIRKGAATRGPLGPLEDPFNWLPRMKLAQGDPGAAQSLLEQVPLEYSPGDWIWNIRFKTALCLRDYDAANRVIAATPAKYADYAFDLGSENWAYGQVARARGDKQKAQAAFAAARGKMEAQQGDKPKDAPYFAGVAKLDAGLGRKEEAIREARRAVDLGPIAKDWLNGPDNIVALALVYAWTGERDRAIEQLEKVATIPGSPAVPTYGDLLLNPCWDSLRGDPRFEKIIADLAPKDAKQ
jgi:TolB-like protein